MNKVEHIVVLMMENRSFDSMLGKLYPKSENFNGLSGNEYNIHNGEKIYVWNDPSGASHPYHDPGENFSQVNQQIFNLPKPSKTLPPGSKATMGGFCDNYHIEHSNIPVKEVMHYHTPDQLPALSYLARQFAVSDAWFSSCPSQTWPNRFFLHTSTANGYESNLPHHFPYTMPSIFSRFPKNGWKVYFNDFPLTTILTDTHTHLNRFYKYETFKQDLSSNTLPLYSFIEPSYFISDSYPQSQQPPHNIGVGDTFIADVYNSLRNSPYFTKTLLVILYDEHGGIYDHVPPPSVIPPEPQKKGQVFAFDRLGVRVPAVVVSPYIPKGTIFRAPENSQPFDHTSIIQTLRKRFNLGMPLTKRDANAPDLFPLLSLQEPTNMGENAPFLPIPTSNAFYKQMKALPMTDLAKSAQIIAHHLPGINGNLEIIEDHDKAWESMKKKLNKIFSHLEF